MPGTNIVIIRGTHLEAAAPTEASYSLIFANYILEGIAPPPLAASAPDIAFHGVTRGKVVPRANELDRLDRGIRLTGNLGVSS